jgi:pyruvate kinase
LRREARRAGLDVPVLAKIERPEAVDRAAEIVAAFDGIMVARGDLGVELPLQDVPLVQKRAVTLARDHAKPVIVATQMLESMIGASRPTRAEASDVANAVLDGTDAVMLSGESAVGKYPSRAVEAMAEVIEGAETYQLARTRGRGVDGHVDRTDQAIARAVMYTANHMDVEAIVALTESGSTALWMSRIRSDIPIFAFTRHLRTQRRVALYRGVYPIPFDVQDSDPAALYRAVSRELVVRRFAAAGDTLILTMGELSGVSGGTNTMKILEVTP